MLEQVNALNGKQQWYPYSNTYNPGWAHNPKLSYGNTNNIQNPQHQVKQTFQQLPGFQPRPSYHHSPMQSRPPFQQQQQQQFQQPHAPQKSNVEVMLEQVLSQQSQYMRDQNQKNEEFSTSISQLKSSHKMVETQLAQIAQQVSQSMKSQGQFPGNTEANPKGQMNALTLRNGKVLEETTNPKSMFVEDKAIVIEDEGKAMEEIVVEKKQAYEKEASLTPPRVYVPPVPFPQRLAKAKLEQKYGKFLDILKVMHINIPFLEAISEIPSYGKFLKKLLSNKKKLGASTTINLSKECSAILLNKLPQKLDDPGSFSIPCSIRGIYIQRALCDLGASVSLMPLSIFKRLQMMDLKPTRVSLQLVDRSVKFPLGVVEDVPLAIGKLVIPCDFFVMDIPEDTQVPIILGRPCLATAGAMIDVSSGKLSLQVGEDKVEFELSKTMGGPSMSDSCYRVDVLEEYLFEPSLECTSSDKLQDCLTNTDSEDAELLAYAWMLDSSPSHLTEPPVEALQVTGKLGESSKPPEVELKPLPSSLKHVFLGENSTYPVIVNSALNDSQISKLLIVLRKYKSVIGYAIDDLKGISPSFVHIESFSRTIMHPPLSLNDASILI
ncbi:uncharacterized protein LOC141601482 [Silene latifolia]|uniref:uncharacterized protein LOC141601482 n=1 Tax=Silene latifolia TaxID=37657 RepID=UPI003D779D40